MPEVAQHWSPYGIAIELKVDRQRVAKELAVLQPVAVKNNKKYFLMADAARVLFGGKDGALDLTAERARLAKEQADKLEMDNAVQRGELIPISIVTDHLVTVFANVRARLLSLPPRGASIAIAARSVDQIEEQLRHIVYEALDELTRPMVIDQSGAVDLQATPDPDRESVGRPAPKTQQRGKRRTRAMAD